MTELPDVTEHDERSSSEKFVLFSGNTCLSFMSIKPIIHDFLVDYDVTHISKLFQANVIQVELFVVHRRYVKG